MTPPPAPVIVRPKDWRQSRTLRFNAALGLACVAGLVASRDRWVSALLVVGFGVACGNIALRLTTWRPLTIQIGGITFDGATTVTGDVAGDDVTYAPTVTKRRTGY